MPSSERRPPKPARTTPPSGPAANAAPPASGDADSDVASGENALASDEVAFAHESERQFALLLDFYQIEWQYEPRTFDIEWDDAGEVTKRFSPDFYLPQFDLYIEITTLNQKLVTKKNRKVRRLRELYPEIQVKVFYQRDYLRLLEKYGLAGRAKRTAGERGMLT